MATKQYMRAQAISIFELTKGFSGEPDSAMKVLLKMAGYVMELTNEDEDPPEDTINIGNLDDDHYSNVSLQEELADLEYCRNCNSSPCGCMN